MKSVQKAQKTAGITLAAALLVAVPVVASWPTPVEPSGPNSGMGRILAAFPTIVDPNGPNSGTSRTPV